MPLVSNFAATSEGLNGVFRDVVYCLQSQLSKVICNKMFLIYRSGEVIVKVDFGGALR